MINIWYHEVSVQMLGVCLGITLLKYYQSLPKCHVAFTLFYPVYYYKRWNTEIQLFHTASYEVPPSGTLFHIRSVPPHLWTYSNCCQVCSVQVEHSVFICVERSKQNGLLNNNLFIIQT